MAGKYELQDLDMRLNQLAVRVKRGRREELAGVVAELRTFIDEVKQEVPRDQAEVVKARDAYRARHPVISRLGFEARVDHWQNVAPLDHEARQDLVVLLRALDLLALAEPAARPLEWATVAGRGVCGVYNGATGHVEWRQAAEGNGVYGVYNPTLGAIEWGYQAGGGVCGVWNPRLGMIMWQTQINGGVAGVYDPDAGEVVWRLAPGSGVCGIWSPITRSVEWRGADCGSAVALGLVLENPPRITEQRAWFSGICCVFWDGSTYRTTASYAGPPVIVPF